jgi:adenine-specific DNA-methyltransferase
MKTQKAPKRAVEQQGCSLSVARIRCADLRHVAKAWAETLPDQRRAEAVASFAMAALDAYAQAVRTEDAAACPKTMGQPQAELARSAGVAAAPLPMAEALHWLTSLYSGLLPVEMRGRLGAFYTPPALVGRLLDQAEEAGLSWTTARVLDPAAGGAAFLIDAVARVCAAFKGCEPAFLVAQLATRIHGLELDPRAARLGQRALEIALADLLIAARQPCPIMIHEADSLEAEIGADYDLVVGNPPYGRVSLTVAQRERFRRGLYGHANLYGVFTDLALRWTKPGGLIAFLTPTSVLSGQYFSALRTLLGDEAPPVAIDFVHARKGVFEDVQQETMLAVYRKDARRRRAQIHYIHVDTATETRVIRNGTVAIPSPSSAPWLAPRDAAHSTLIARAETMPTRLSDLGYRVSTGPLVWNRFKDQLGNTAGGKRTFPLIWSEAVLTDGQFRFRADKKNHQLFFTLKKGDDWLLVTEPAVLVQRTTAKEQRRRLIAAELPGAFVRTHGGVVVENHLNMVVPIGKPKVSPAVLAALLNSAVVDQLFRCISGSVAVSAFELEALPLPHEDKFAALTKLVVKKADRDTLDSACAALYETHL